jgi:MFS family permease
MPMPKKPPWILPTIIFSQFAGMSLWFAGNAVLEDLQRQWSLGPQSLGYTTSAVQLGFIVGTLCFAFLTIADRFSPRIVFFICSLFGAFSNLLIYLVADGLALLLVFRFLSGFFLAGIYPVGMKIADGWYQQELGEVLGFLIGAIVLGTAFPHLLKGAGRFVPWETVILSVSGVALLGGLAMLILVPDGPFLSQGNKFDPKALVVIFQSKDVRAASFGYFGHMWELVAFFAFVPVILAHYVATNPQVSLNIPFWSFCIIAGGCMGCVGGGIISKKAGSASVAFIQLAASGICCLFSPLFFHASTGFFLFILIFWGMVVSGDSPQFSTLIAKKAPPTLVGSALTIVTSIGFAITIVSIELLNSVSLYMNHSYIFLILSVGPILGLGFLWPLVRDERQPGKLTTKLKHHDAI